MKDNYQEMKKYVKENHTPMPNSALDFEKHGFEFCGFLCEMYIHVWSEMERTKGESDWTCDITPMKNTKGSTMNRLRKFTIQALTEGFLVSCNEYDGKIIVKANSERFVNHD